MRKSDSVLAVANALFTLVSPSLHMISTATGLSIWTVKRHLTTLREEYGVAFRYVADVKAADGRRGHYVLDDPGVLDKKKVVLLFMEKAD